MDAALQLKTNLINRILHSNDIHFLNALQRLLDQSKKELFELSPEQSQSIKLGELDIEKGNYQESSELIVELRKWLEKV